MGDTGALARAALSKSTWAKYDNAFRQWTAYCLSIQKTVPTASAQDFEKFLVQKSKEVRTGVAIREMRAGIVASAKLRKLDATIYETDTANRIIRRAMRMRPQLPTLPVTFDAAEALRRAAQVESPANMEMGKTFFLLMILGPWRLADVLAMRPSAIIPRGEAYYCALQTKGGKGDFEWRVVEPCNNKAICPVVHLKYLLSSPQVIENDQLWIHGDGSPITSEQARNMVQQYMLHIGIGPEWTHIIAVRLAQAQWYLLECHTWLWHAMEAGAAWRTCSTSTSKHSPMMMYRVWLRDMRQYLDIKLL